MKRTLLDLVQDILSSMDSDEVNSINDTVESMQVARVVRTVWEQLVVKTNYPELFTLFNLEASGDVSKPTLMTLPSEADNILWLRYQKQATTDQDPLWLPVSFLPPEMFFKTMYNLKPSAANVIDFTHEGDHYFAVTDKAPEYYTSIDDRTLIFDSYDSAVDTTLQSSKSQGYGQRVIEFLLEDNYVPVLDSNMFPLLLNESKALAFAELKQTAHAKAEKYSREEQIRGQRSKQNVPGNTSYFATLPNYGRK